MSQVPYRLRYAARLHLLEKWILILLSVHVELLLLPAESCKHDPWVGHPVRFEPQQRYVKQTLTNSKLSSKESSPTNRQSDNVKSKRVHQVVIQNRANRKKFF